MIVKKSIALMVISTILLSLLSGCGSDETVVEQLKQPFQIQTLNLYNSENLWYITKSSKVQWASEIVISSMVSGKIKDIVYGLGKKVSAWTLLVQLQDSTAPVGKAIKDAQLALERAQLTEANTTDDIERQKKKILYDLNNVDGNVTWSNTQIQLAKLEQDLEKAEFDYQAKLKSDGQTNENLITSARNIQSDLEIILTDTANETDKLLGITDIYTNGEYKDLRVYLWAKDITIKDKITKSFYTISSLQQQLDVMNSADINDQNVTTYLKTYQSIVTWLSDHFVLIKKLFIESIEDARYTTQMMLVQTTFSTLQAKNSWLNTSITSQLNSIRSYFVSYEDQQASLARQIESLRSQIALTKRSLDDAQFNATLGAERSEIWFDGQIKNASLSRESAALQLTQANFNQSKFSITSPLQWFVADVLVDFWQEVSPGTPLIKIISTQQQIETTLTSEEIKNITLWQKVIVTSEVGEWKWIIAQIAQTADKSWSFKIIIVLDDSTIPTWLFVTVKIPVQQWTLLLPLNALSIVDTNTAVAYFWDWTKVIPTSLTIRSIFGDQVEITDQIPTNYELITTDLSNYDERSMEIVKDWTLNIKN